MRDRRAVARYAGLRPLSRSFATRLERQPESAHTMEASHQAQTAMIGIALPGRAVRQHIVDGVSERCDRAALRQGDSPGL